MSGKGSRPRPKSVESDTYSKNWDAIFAKDTKNYPDKSDTEYERKQEVESPTVLFPIEMRD